MTHKTRGSGGKFASRKAEKARRKALGIGTRISTHGALEQDYPPLHLEDVRVGDTVQFIGSTGFRLATVKTIHPKTRMLRVESRLTLGGQDHVFLMADVHETRLLENLGPRKREVV